MNCIFYIILSSKESALVIFPARKRDRSCQTGCQTAVGIRRKAPAKYTECKNGAATSDKVSAGSGGPPRFVSQSRADLRPSHTSPNTQSLAISAQWNNVVLTSGLRVVNNFVYCDKDLLKLAKDNNLWSNMLTSSNQYLRPDYLSPLPTTVSFFKLDPNFWNVYEITIQDLCSLG